MKGIKGIKIEDTEPGKKLLMFLDENEIISLSGFLKLSKISYHKGVKILSDYIALGLIESDYIDKKFVYKAVQKN